MFFDRQKFYGGYLMFVFAFVACAGKVNDKQINANNENKTKISNVRPGATNQDTLFIEKFPAVIFYNPDTLQLENIKKVTKPSVFQSQTHEFFYQMRNARIVMKKDWPQLTQIITNTHRYIAFKKGSSIETIDLNKIEDFSGMILWNGIKKPQKIDMMSIETELYYYFKQ